MDYARKCSQTCFFFRFKDYIMEVVDQLDEYKTRFFECVFSFSFLFAQIPIFWSQSFFEVSPLIRVVMTGECIRS